MGRVATLALLLLASCHLADDIDAPKCEKGFHPENQRCVQNETTEQRVTIAPAAGGTLCTVDVAQQRPPVLTPETLTVKVREEFQFENTDVVAHEIRGADGTLWLTVPPGKLSDFTLITKAGNWGYRVSACAKGGAVTVE